MSLKEIIGKQIVMSMISNFETNDVNEVFDAYSSAFVAILNTFNLSTQDAVAFIKDNKEESAELLLEAKEIVDRCTKLYKNHTDYFKAIGSHVTEKYNKYNEKAMKEQKENGETVVKIVKKNQKLFSIKRGE